MIWFGVAFFIWAVGHSVTASHTVKRWAMAQLGERAFKGLYRLIYNIVSVLTILPILWLMVAQIPATELWRIPTWLGRGLQLVGLIGAGVTLYQTDVWRFMGIRQAVRYLQGEPTEFDQGPLIISGMYGWMRHPLYTFSLLLLWATPVMTLSSLALAIGATLYFWLGSIYEEQKLVAEFGDAYRTYQQQVYRLLPLKSYKGAGL